MRTERDMRVVAGSGNVFADLGLPNAEELQIKAELTRQICHRIAELKLTQVQAAKRLGLKQPDVSRLVQGRYIGFSMDRMLKLLNALGIDVDIILRPHGGKRRVSKSRAMVRVMAESV